MVVEGGATPMWPIGGEGKSSEEKREREGFHSDLAVWFLVPKKSTLIFAWGTIDRKCAELLDFVNRIRRGFPDRHLGRGPQIGLVRFRAGTDELIPLIQGSVVNSDPTGL